MTEKEIYQALTERMGAPESKYVPQVWRMLVTPEEGRMLLELPAFPDELAAKFGMDQDQMNKKLEEWVLKGIVIPFVKEGREKFGLCRGVGNFFESASHVTHKIVGDELLDIWGQWLQTEWVEEMRKAEQAGKVEARVFPFREAIKDDTGLRPEEDIWVIVDQAEKIAVVDCPCRLVLKKCDHTVECCFLFDRGAELALRRHSGRELSKEEAHELIRSCVKEGLIPSGANRVKVTNLCFCCNDCCLVYGPQLKFGLDISLPSRYLSVVDQKGCDGCQTCVEACPYSAIEMGKVAGSKKMKAQVAASKCYGCGVCVPNCPQQAMELKLVRPPEHLPAS